MNEIEQTLTHSFTRHRIVIWYDAKRELRAEFDAVALPDVAKIVLDRNTFGVKYRILRAQPGQKFLLYHAGPPPDDPLDNWLLDVQLAYGQFRADRASLWLSEIGLGQEFADLVTSHIEFFKAARRREALKTMLAKDDGPRQIVLKMLAVCARAEPRIDDVLRALLDELAADRDDAMRLIARSALADALWEHLERTYGYTSESPGLRDFVITLFQACYAMELGAPAQLNSDALVFLKQWKDSVRYQRAFGVLSDECAAVLAIEEDLQPRDYTMLRTVTTFELVDRKILSDLVREVAARTVGGDEVARWVRNRRQSHWYADYQHEYAALEEAAVFMDTLEQVDLSARAFIGRTVADVVAQYAGTWYRLDQGYRAFITHVRRSGQTTLFADLAQRVENLYTNRYLLPLNNRWQAVIDTLEAWERQPGLSQAAFFERLVRPFLARGHKVFIVISDGMRYEIGEALLRLIRQEDRYDATIEPALTLLPSETQLGMAALLPHTRLTIADDGETVLVDGNSATGTENRAKILAQAGGWRATALRAEDLLAMSREQSRSLFRDHDVVYVYHNRIDATGDKRDSEERVFDAAAAALEELVRIVKKLTSANVTNMLLTADHGFIYQHQPLDESDFAGQEPTGTEIIKRHRRFVLGRGLQGAGGATSSFKHFIAAEVGLDGEMEMLIPKSINRLRIKGAGSRYVHGGAALQEVVIPVIKVNKKRESDVRQVNVDILRGAGGATISTGQLTVTFYQTEAATEKVQPRLLRAGIYTQEGDLISDRHELPFDRTSEDPRDREMRVRFMLTQKANQVDDQDVILRLEEQVEDTAHYQIYKTARYVLRRTFTSDFEF